MSEQVCEHGELRRQCVKCELASERDEYVRLAGELQSKLETLQKNYDLGQAALALAESEGKEVASRWATAVTLLEKAERERNEARSRLDRVALLCEELNPDSTAFDLANLVDQIARVVEDQWRSNCL